MIPRRIFTIWLGDSVMAPLIEHCVATHAIPEFEHRMIGMDNHGCTVRYYLECIEARRWAKAADFLRMWLLEREGGVYLDADVEVVGPLDNFLGNTMFAGREQNGWISNAVVGSEAHTPLLRRYLELVDANYRGSGDLVFEVAMSPFNMLIQNMGGVTVFAPEYFHPFDHQSGVVLRTENTRTYHHFMLSWTRNPEPPFS